jgi:hypothetical protein
MTVACLTHDFAGRSAVRVPAFLHPSVNRLLAYAVIGAYRPESKRLEIMRLCISSFP